MLVWRNSMPAALGGVLDDPRHLVLHADEELKSYYSIGPLIEHLATHGFRKSSKLIAIGGGVIQDATGFLASILFRGVPWVFFPTTLLSQCDSCIGSKTSINFGSFKNQLGNFYPPASINIDHSLLDTLPAAEIVSGLGEMAHYYLVESERDFERFASELGSALQSRETLHRLILRTLAIKKRFIEIDEFDRKERQILNYGHSFGHALETVTSYTLPHGIAVAYGMDMANFVSAKMGLLTMQERNRIREVLARIWSDHPIGSVPLTDFIAALRRDKKNTGSTIGLVLSRGVGKMFKTQVEVTDQFEGWIEQYLEFEHANA